MIESSGIKSFFFLFFFGLIKKEWVYIHVLMEDSRRWCFKVIGSVLRAELLPGENKLSLKTFKPSGPAVNFES